MNKRKEKIILEEFPNSFRIKLDGKRMKLYSIFGYSIFSLLITFFTIQMEWTLYLDNGYPNELIIELTISIILSALLIYLYNCLFWSFYGREILILDAKLDKLIFYRKGIYTFNKKKLDISNVKFLNCFDVGVYVFHDDFVGTPTIMIEYQKKTKLKYIGFGAVLEKEETGQLIDKLNNFIALQNEKLNRF